MREEVQALVDRYRMRKNLADLREAQAGRSNQVVHDAHIGFRGDREVVFQQQVIILMDGPMQRVLDRDHRRVD